MSTLQENKAIIPIHRPKLREKLFFFSSGIITSVPLTLFVGTFTDSLCVVMPIFYARLCSTAIFTPFVEEFAKAYPLFYRHGETEKSVFTLGFLVGLGFGIAEFFSYVVVLGAPFYIRLPVIFFHAAGTSITAYGIATKRPAQFYMIAVILHFSNNFSALFGSLWVLIGPATLAITYSLSWYLYDKTSERIVD
ncbi:PrsW family intramembrane metalloprotease [Candidatus Bathyarchaeota archaeon]|nr:PrsW family intramembrane metalloprotease [Candidatus Bathyarchaeota archaeon]